MRYTVWAQGIDDAHRRAKTISLPQARKASVGPR
jgi:hypothetical protein